MALHPVLLPQSSEPEAAEALSCATPERKKPATRRDRQSARVAELSALVREQEDMAKIGVGAVAMGAVSILSVTHFLSSIGVAGICVGMAGAGLTAASLMRKRLLEHERDAVARSPY